MDIASFADLFKNYCANYRYQETPESAVKPLAFFHYDLEELAAGVFSSLKPPALFLTTPEDDFGGENTDNVSESFEAQFMILLQLPGKDIRKKAETIQKAKDIADNIIRRMLHDCAVVEVLEGFNINGIKAGQVNRTLENLYGWSVSFNIEQAFDAEIKTEVWEDLN